MIQIPRDQLSEVALKGLIEEFILREGTDYGNYEYSLEQKFEQILKLIKNGKVLIVFDPVTESPSLIRKEEAKGSF